MGQKVGDIYVRASVARGHRLQALDQQDLGHYTTTESIIVPNL